MRKAEPKLKLYLAQKALYHYYEKDVYTDEEKRCIAQYCKDNMQNDNLIKLSMRVMKERNNDRIVGCILDEASEEERQFLYSKYKLNMTYVSISMKLHVHPNGLQRWRDKFLTEIATMLFFELPDTDAFSITKLQIIIDVMDENIVFFEKFYTDKVNSKSLQILINRQQRYQKVLASLKRVISQEPKDSLGKIIKAKLNNNTASVEELSKISGFSTGMISEKLMAFSNQCLKCCMKK
jgi:hypothetical protein